MTLTETTLDAQSAQPASFGTAAFTPQKFSLAGSRLGRRHGFLRREISRHELEIVYRTINVPRLPDPFAGLKIVQISDFHFTNTPKQRLLRQSSAG